MNDKSSYLTLINNAITSYSLQSIFIKGYALVVAIALYAITTIYNTGTTYPIMNLALTFVIVLLWVQDAHSFRQKVLYSRLYRKARTEERASYSMDVSKFYKDVPWMHILWRPQVCQLYIGMVISSAAIALIRT